MGFFKQKQYSKYYPNGKRETPRGKSSFQNPSLNLYLNLAKSCRNWQLAFLIMAFFFGISLFSYYQLSNLSIINYALMKRLKKHEDRPDVGTWLRQRILQKKNNILISP